MNERLIEIMDWKDLHRFCMASRDHETVKKLIDIGKTMEEAGEASDSQCYIFMKEELLRAKRGIEELIGVLENSEEFCKGEVAKYRVASVEEPTE